MFEGEYDKGFQEKICQGLLTDHKWAQQMMEVMKPGFFDQVSLEQLTDLQFQFFEAHKGFPSLDVLLKLARDNFKESDLALFLQIRELLVKFKGNPNLGDQKYIKSESLSFCQTQAMKQAIENSLVFLEKGEMGKVVEIIRAAAAIGIPYSVGHIFFEDMEARFADTVRLCVPTGIAQLDANTVLRGGLGRGELGVVIGNTGTGKSHYLVSMGTAAMKVGKNVLHYSFELTETSVAIRYDSNLCQIASNDVVSEKDYVLDVYKQQEKNWGKLIIKEYPTGSASVLTIKNHIEKLGLKGFVPNLIIIDYADIMRSEKGFESLRHELKQIYEDLRSLAMERNIPIWTASQANRAAANSEVVGMESMSEAYGKAMVADFIVSISRKKEEKATGDARLYIAKNRAGRDGIIFPITIDTSTSTFTVQSDKHLDLNDLVKNSEKKQVKAMKSKWDKIKTDMERRKGLAENDGN